jgi:hypothetical protein
MKSSLPALGAVAIALLGLTASPSHAQYPVPCGQPCCVRTAPDMCNGYFYCTNGCTWFGPSYCVYPPFPPFNGMLPGGPPTPHQFQGAQGVALPYNPWTRSPRDYFMWTEAQQEILTRQQRPAFVP